MNDVLEEIVQLLRGSRILKMIVTQRRKRKNLGIDTSSTIINSKIPGLAGLGAHSLLKDSVVSGHVRIGARCAVFNTALSGNMLIGSYTTLNGPTSIITDANQITIGKFCSIAPGCYLQTYNHRVDRLSSYNMHKNVFSVRSGVNKAREGDNFEDSASKGGISIGNDVWIGTKVTILSGVTIGDGAVVGANSLVSKDIPPYAIVGGVPASILRYRFDKAILKKLLELKWWDWPIERILASEELFSGPLSLSKLNDQSK